MTGIDDIEYFRKARVERGAYQASRRVVTEEELILADLAFYLCDRALPGTAAERMLKVLVDIDKLGLGPEDQLRVVKATLARVDTSADCAVYLEKWEQLEREGLDYPVGVWRSSRDAMIWVDWKAEVDCARFKPCFSEARDTRYLDYQDAFSEEAPRVGGSSNAFIQAMKERYMPLFHKQVSMGVDVALPVRREVIPTSPGLAFGPIIKGPYTRLTMDMRSDGCGSKIPGARADWAPSQAVTYEPDLGEDLEISTEEERAWRANHGAKR